MRFMKEINQETVHSWFINRCQLGIYYLEICSRMKCAYHLLELTCIYKGEEQVMHENKL